jgi:hypothetical protein
MPKTDVGWNMADLGKSTQVKNQNVRQFAQ